MTAGAVAAALVLGAAGASAARPALRFEVFSHTGIPLVDVAWTGNEFVVVQNTDTLLTRIDTAGRVGSVLARLPRLVEETRCIAAPGAHGFPPGALYCHTPDNRIYRVSGDGRTIGVFAALPEQAASDGALAFDTVGRFGYRLVAATGRSGAGQASGGTVYTIDAGGRVRRVGSYAGPSGADQVAIAPRRFGSAGGDALLSVDAGASGKVVAMDARGHTRTIARFGEGVNPVVPLVQRRPVRGAAHPGLYVTDTQSTNVWFVPAAQFARYAGAVLVGGEVHAHFWLVSPRSRGFRTDRLPTNLPDGAYNLEGARFVS